MSMGNLVEFLGTLFFLYVILATGNALAIGAALAIDNKHKGIINIYTSIIFNYKEIRQSSEIVFNVSSGKGTHVKTVFSMIAKEVEKITGTNSQIESVPWPSQVNEID